MAKRRKFNRDRNSGRRMVMTIAVIVAIAAVFWKLVLSPDETPNQLTTPTNQTAGDSLKSEGFGDGIVPTSRDREEAVTHHNVKLTTNEPNDKTQTTLNEKNIPTINGVKPPKPMSTEIALKYYHQGAAAMAKRDYLAARQLLSKAVKQGLNPPQEKTARDYINQASDQWLFSANVYDEDPLCSRYQVTAGDRLVVIANRMGVPYQLLMKINKITDAKRLRAGESIKVVKGPFHAVVDRSAFQLTVYLGDILVRTYPVGLGMPGRQTPTGKWRVKVGKKQINPAWTDVETNIHYYPNDPENPLGERWIGLEGLSGQAKGRVGFGIHGTIKPEEIGSAASRGCIRLLNKDIIELYDMLEEQITEVVVVD